MAASVEFTHGWLAGSSLQLLSSVYYFSRKDYRCCSNRSGRAQPRARRRVRFSDLISSPNVFSVGLSGIANRSEIDAGRREDMSSLSRRSLALSLPIHLPSSLPPSSDSLPTAPPSRGRASMPQTGQSRCITVKKFPVELRFCCALDGVWDPTPLTNASRVRDILCGERHPHNGSLEFVRLKLQSVATRNLHNKLERLALLKDLNCRSNRHKTCTADRLSAIRSSDLAFSTKKRIGMSAGSSWRYLSCPFLPSPAVTRQQSVNK